MRKLLLLALFLVAGAPQEKSAVDVFVDGPTTLAPGSPASLRVAVLESRGLGLSAPVEGASVQVTLGKVALYTGKTDRKGTLSMTFRVPEIEEGRHELKVEVKSAAGAASFPQAVTVKREHKILLVTDKPLYQPGQTIHIRALALAEMTLQALGDAEIVFEVEDARGNKVFKRSARTSRFGVAAADFTLADEVNMGDFKIAAQVRDAKAEKTVAVKKYVLPKFKVELKTEKNWYEPRALVKGHVQADYFFGKPVEGQVTVKASTFDLQFREFARVQAKGDAQGRAEFEFRLPDYFTGTPLEKGNALLQVEVEVTDRADHIEKVSRSLVVSDQPLRLNAIAESGKLVPDVENRLFAVVTTPDGAPVETKVTCNGQEGRTSGAVFATFLLTPKAVDLRPNAQGQRVMDVELKAQGATARLEIPAEHSGESILLRLDKAIYEAGQTAKLEVYSNRRTGTIFLDLVKKGQTVLTTTAELSGGRATYPLALDPSLFGSIEVHAYVLRPEGDIVRDTKVAYVQPPQSLRVAVTGDLPEYRPGAPCTLTFRVTDQDNVGRQAALGVIIVDESVYALQDMQPGLEKIYFTLEKELAQPRAEQCVGHSLTDSIQAARQEVAAMLLANVEPPVRRWNVNTLARRQQQYAQKLQKIYWGFYNYIMSGTEFTEKDAKTGRRVFRKDLLSQIASKPQQYGLAKEDLQDPWGKAFDIAGLARLNHTFRVEFWWKLRSWNAVWTAWHQIGQKVAAGDPIEGEYGNDCFGDALSMERLARIDAAFSKENLVRLMEDRRRAAFFRALLSHALSYDAFSTDPSGKLIYKAGLLEEMVRLNTAVAMFKSGLDLAKLAQESPSFKPENLARLVEDHRRQAILNALVQRVRKAGAAAVSTFDAQETKWVYRASVLDELVANKLVSEGALRDAAGKKLELAELERESGAFKLGNVTRMALQQQMAEVYNQLNALNRNKYLDRAHGCYIFPPEALEELKGSLVDPWGEKIRLERYEKQRQARWYWFPFNELVSAGPDRQFGTSDDVKEEAVLAVQGYPVGARGGMMYAHDPKVLQPLDGGGWENEERDDVVKLGAIGGRPGRFRGKGEGLDFGEARREFAAAPEAPVAAGVPMKAPAETKAKDAGPAGGGGTDEALAPAARVREYFPETLFWNPQIITNEDGTCRLPVTMADSITTWRLSASANTADGLLGSTTHALRVFQDFFVDIDFPVALTQKDVVSVPVAIFNYLKEEQKVELRIEKQDWFDLRDDETKVVRMKAGEVKAVTYTVQVKGIGPRTLTVHARGTRLSDAVRRPVEIVPDGKMFEVVLNDRLDANVNQAFEIPEGAIDGASKIFVKVYPGVFASVLDGLEGMLRMPGG